MKLNENKTWKIKHALQVRSALLKCEGDYSCVEFFNGCPTAIVTSFHQTDTVHNKLLNHTCISLLHLASYAAPKVSLRFYKNPSNFSWSNECTFFRQ